VTKSVGRGQTVEPYALLESNHPQTRTGKPASLFVKECAPHTFSFTRAAPLRFASVTTLEEALALPWIAKLPGEKRIRFLHGQIFVVQQYVGCKLIRAHLCPDEEPEAITLQDTDAVLKAQEKMRLEYAL